jgi:PmbA protein
MLMNIVAIGAEQETRGSVQTGSVLIDNMQVAGE